MGMFSGLPGGGGGGMGSSPGMGAGPAGPSSNQQSPLAAMIAALSPDQLTQIMPFLQMASPQGNVKPPGITQAPQPGQTAGTGLNIPNIPGLGSLAGALGGGGKAAADAGSAAGALGALAI